MCTKTRLFVIATIFSMVLPFPRSLIYGQEPIASPTSAATAATTDELKSDAEAAAAKPTTTPDANFWTQEEMTGDWGGIRSRWKEKGVGLEFKLTQFFQGVASGGIRENSEYNGKFQTAFKFDLGKLAGWQF